MPVPGRLTASITAAISVPAGMATWAVMLRRMSGMKSAGSTGAFSARPMAAWAARVAATRAAMSSGSAESLWSGPSSVLSRVKCFSMISAPSAAAAMATAVPMVWSENPTGTPKRCLKSIMLARLA